MAITSFEDQISTLNSEPTILHPAELESVQSEINRLEASVEVAPLSIVHLSSSAYRSRGLEGL